MSSLTMRSLAPRTQLTAMVAMLAAVLGLVWALTHGQADPAGAGTAATIGYGLVTALAVIRWRVEPFALVLATVRLTAALAAAPVQAVRANRRREGWS